MKTAGPAMFGRQRKRSERFQSRSYPPRAGASADALHRVSRPAAERPRTQAQAEPGKEKAGSRALAVGAICNRDRGVGVIRAGRAAFLGIPARL